MTLVALALLGCGSAPTEPAPEPAPVVQPVDGAPEPPAERTWALERDVARKRLELAEQRAAKAPNAWSAHLAVVEARSTLTRLEGGLAHHDAAWAAWRLARAAVPDPPPELRRAEARLLQAEHRFRDALAAIEGLDGREDRLLRAAFRFELGEYAPAVEAVEAELAKEDDPSTRARLAGMLWKLGRFDDAERHLDAALASYHGRDQWVVAWNHLVRGLMDLERERYPDALAHYRDADAALPGWWLVREHIAEIHALEGRPAEALPIYEAVVAETGSPELMGALADTLDALGRGEEGASWRAKALAGFEAQLVSHPTSAGGHALEFLLEHGDPARALEIARANVALRPNGEARLLLADALEKTGDPAGAAALRLDVRASGWWVGP